MVLTKAAINKYKDLLPGIEGYSTVIVKIEENCNSFPDISIEACKSLIEGIAKKSLNLLSPEYNEKKKIRKDCDNKLPTLVKTAFDHVFKQPFEVKLFNSLNNLIEEQDRLNSFINQRINKASSDIETSVNGISSVRDNRGDISHGRIYPKIEESEIHLSNSIKSITDGICSYMIHEIYRQYSLKQNKDEKLNYYELEDFNDWLDEQYNIFSIKVDNSRLIYENAYEKYKDLYDKEYLELFDENTQELVDDSTLSDSHKRVKKSFSSNDLQNNDSEIEVDSQKYLSFINDFSKKESLDSDGLYKLLDNYMFSKTLPLRDEVVNIMNNKPSLKERKKTVESLIFKIESLFKSLIKEDKT